MIKLAFYKQIVINRMSLSIGQKRPCSDSPSSTSCAKRLCRFLSSSNCPPTGEDEILYQPTYAGLPKQNLDSLGLTPCATCYNKTTSSYCKSEQLPGTCHNPMTSNNSQYQQQLIHNTQQVQRPWYTRIKTWFTSLIPSNFNNESKLVEKNCFDKISEKALRNFIENNDILTCAEEKCTAFKAVLETWNAMPASQKVRYYWEALEHGNIKTYPFKNFFYLYKYKSTAPRLEVQNRARNAWNKMTFNQKLPFIVESLIAKMIVRQTDIDEKFIKKHFERYRNDICCECE